MTNSTNTTLMNFIGGEWSPFMAARTDLETYPKSLKWCQNFVVLPQGGANYRPGTSNTSLTPNGATGYFIPFQFSATDALVILALDHKFLFYRNGGLILNTAVNISGISQGLPATVTANAHGYANGTKVFITGVMGMPQIAGRFFIVQGATTNTFTLTDEFGNTVDSTLYSAYISGGTVASIYSISSPYFLQDLPYIRYTQVGDLMYLVCRNQVTGAAYPPYTLTRNGFTNWTLAIDTRTNDPFTPTTLNPNTITQANPPVVTVSSTTGMANGDVFLVSGATGMTQINGNFYTVQNLTSTTFTLGDLNGNPINGTAFGAYTARSATFTYTNQWPSVVSFTSDGRLAYANTGQNPEGLWESLLPVKNQTQYDNFTTGDGDNYAVAYDLAPPEGTVDPILALKQFNGLFAALGSSTIRQLYGDTQNSPPTPTAVNTLTTVQGCAFVQPIVITFDLLFVDANGRRIRGLRYNFAYTTYECIDYNLTSDHLGNEGTFTKLVYAKGNPDIVWVLRSDGALLSFTFNNIEQINGWARHYVGGNGSVLDITAIRGPSGNDQLYLLVERVINGNVCVSVEVLSSWPTFPSQPDYYSGNQATDYENFVHATQEALKPGTFLDASISYAGAARGSVAAAQLTPSAMSGASITLTASEGVFTTLDVGSRIRKVYANNAGGGIAEITAYVSPTQVTANVLIPFDNTVPIPAGSWEIMVNTVQNLQLYEGQTVGVTVDGGKHPSQVVTNGAIQLNFFGGNINVGFPYTGLLITPNIDPGSKTGSAASKPRNISRFRWRFKDTMGGKIGTSQYDLEEVVFNTADQQMGVPVQPFNGIIDKPPIDSWSEDSKNCYLVQTDPTPCTLLAIDAGFKTNEPA